jgi:hypothetical protein
VYFLDNNISNTKKNNLWAMLVGLLFYSIIMHWSDKKSSGVVRWTFVVYVYSCVNTRMFLRIFLANYQLLTLTTKFVELGILVTALYMYWVLSGRLISSSAKQHNKPSKEKSIFDWCDFPFLRTTKSDECDDGANVRVFFVDGKQINYEQLRTAL